MKIPSVHSLDKPHLHIFQLAMANNVMLASLLLHNEPTIISWMKLLTQSTYLMLYTQRLQYLIRTLVHAMAFQ